MKLFKRETKPAVVDVPSAVEKIVSQEAPLVPDFETPKALKDWCEQVYEQRIGLVHTQLSAGVIDASGVRALKDAQAIVNHGSTKKAKEFVRLLEQIRTVLPDVFNQINHLPGNHNGALVQGILLAKCRLNVNSVLN